jgi:UDP-2,3-diacylglucosamine pyrophosphatase LpxH
MPYWSFSSWAKVKVKKAVKFISHFQNIVSEEARRSEVDGVICGHIHHAAMEHMNGVEYINTGDWVESCTAVVEHFDGRLEIIRWMETDQLPVAAAPERFVPTVVEGKAAAAA